MKSSFKIKIEVIVKIVTYIIGLVGFLSVFKHISFVYSSIFVVLSFVAIYFDYKKGFHMPRWFLNLAAVAVILLSLFRLSLDNLIVPAVEGLLILLSIKFLEEKKFRDYMQIYLISLFLLSGSALLTIDIEFSIYFLIMIFMLAVSIVLLTYHSQEPDLELPKSTIIKIALKSLLIPLIAMPMTLFLFIMLPRTSYPFLNFLNRPEKAKTGFTDNVRLGSVSGIQEDETAIFRAHMERIDERHLYWRGIVLDYFDGASWHSNASSVKSQASIVNQRTPLDAQRIVKQTIYLEPYENRYLFALDKPYLITLRDAKKQNDLTFSVSKNIDRRIRYEAVSILSDVIFEEGIDKDRYLQLPENISSEIIKLVREITDASSVERQASSDARRTTLDAQRISSILSFLKDGNYKYSLQNLPVSQTPLDDFLFKHRSGNCEYFASAMAVMLRISGVPARLVGGYRGGYYNDIGKYYLVPQKNAHVWVEAYIDKGWARIDPTPASLEGFVSSHRRDTLFKIKLAIDTITYYWNAFVISYDLEKQLSLFHKIQSAASSQWSAVRLSSRLLATDNWLLLKYFVIPAVLSLFVFILYTLISGRKTEEERLISLFMKKMQRYGYKKEKSDGLEEFVTGIKEAELKQWAFRFVKEFESNYYKDKKFTKEEIKRLKSMLK